MRSTLTLSEPQIAGLVQTDCSCCPEAQHLQSHPALEPSQLICPSTQLTYLDRGDGLFELDGGRVEVVVNRAPGRQGGGADPQADLLSDRPTRTGPKTRIELERATFA